MLIFPFSPQIDHLEDSLSSEVEFSKNVDPAATQPERKTSEMFLRVVTLCTKKKRPHMDKVICCPCKCCHLSLHLTGYFGVGYLSDNLPIQLYSFSLQPFHILFMTESQRLQPDHDST